jgi:alpha-L-arabinofuranosidase
MKSIFSFIAFLSLIHTSIYSRDLKDLHALQGDFVPVESQNDFYKSDDRTIQLKVYPNLEHNVISPLIFGVNTSYFNDTDEIWRHHGIPQKLKKAGVTAMRFPGGEETSFYHRKHPGVNGYEDALDPKAIPGYSPYRGAFQSTWTHPKDWPNNEDFMNFDEFVAHCKFIGSEPIIGLNLSTGKKINSSNTGLQEALDWIQYSKNKGYNIQYWYLDNEPWHFEAGYTFKGDEYLKEVLLYATEIKKQHPELKLIVNPISSEHMGYSKNLQDFVKSCGHVIDIIDVHLYWAWGMNSFDYWQTHTPLNLADKWHPQQKTTISKGLLGLKRACVEAGFPNIDIAVLEWNLAPSDHNMSYSDALQSIIQCEMLIQFIKSDVSIACMWPLIWRTKRDVWAEQDVFPSILQPGGQYESTASSRMMKHLSYFKNAKRIKTKTNSDKVEFLAARKASEIMVAIINKSGLRRKLVINRSFNTLSQEQLDIKTKVWSQQVHSSNAPIFLEPFSMNFLRYTDHH